MREDPALPPWLCVAPFYYDGVRARFSRKTTVNICPCMFLHLHTYIATLYISLSTFARSSTTPTRPSRFVSHTQPRRSPCYVSRASKTLRSPANQRPTLLFNIYFYIPIFRYIELSNLLLFLPLIPALSHRRATPLSSAMPPSSYQFIPLPIRSNKGTKKNKLFPPFFAFDHYHRRVLPPPFGLYLKASSPYTLPFTARLFFFFSSRF